MRERGLGTPATRAAIFETLLRREYVVREGKVIQATTRASPSSGGPATLKSPAMTGEVGSEARAIERGLGDIATFMGEIES